MKMVVIDASFAGAWVLPDESSDAAEKELREILAGGTEMVVAALWHYEMCNLLNSAMRRKRIEEKQVSQALSLLRQIPMQTHDHQEELWQRRMLSLAQRFNLSAYDAAYLELADRLQCPLRTNDRTLRSAAEHLGLPAGG